MYHIIIYHYNSCPTKSFNHMCLCYTLKPSFHANILLNFSVQTGCWVYTWVAEKGAPATVRASQAMLISMFFNPEYHFEVAQIRGVLGFGGYRRLSAFQLPMEKRSRTGPTHHFFHVFWMRKISKCSSARTRVRLLVER